MLFLTIRNKQTKSEHLTIQSKSNTGCPKKTQKLLNHPLLEFECPSTKLNLQVHKKLTTVIINTNTECYVFLWQIDKTN